MKRSEINDILRRAEEFIVSRGFILPRFARFKPEKWSALGGEWDEVRDNMLGWDVTDYGHGRFYEIGLTLFTIRNGSLTDARYSKKYAEKLLISEEGQICPMHFHFSKTEDIINRGGGNLVIQLWQAAPDGELSDKEFDVSFDGERRRVSAGELVTLAPGDSVTLEPYVYHAFWAEKTAAGRGRVLIGEVSSVNDDNSDNRFLEPQGRFPEIEEDAPPVYLLCNEYARYAQGPKA
ncbi:MAG: D-lyxose/D-mannose family sugar isomerase [Oscillospiraceae bacterium]|jgi:D-lyxose ketol-isomerase|nr:D-lyxose/D-mannose family sugar isomerase [Oscillospiraceae bacterium]